MSFQAELVRWAGPSGWTFVSVPDDLVHAEPGPFGRVPVVAIVDGTEWATSVWWDTRSDRWLLAVPARIRGDKDDGDAVDVTISLDGSRR